MRPLRQGRIVILGQRAALCVELANCLGQYHEVEVVGSGDVARELVIRTIPDGVVLECGMLDEAALAWCRRLKSDPKAVEVFVILVSAAFADGRSRALGVEAGAEVCLSEPFCPEELLVYTRKLVRRRKQSESVRAEVLAEANQRLRQSEERLKLALQASRTGVWEQDLKTQAVVWSPECFEIAGMDASDGSFESFLRVLHPEDAPRVLAEVEKMCKEGADYSVEFRMLRSDGQVRWVSSVGRPQFDGAGRPLRVVGTVQDITRSKQAAEVYRLTQFSVDNASEGISWVGPDARFKFVNDAGCRLLGYTREELLRMTVHQIDPKRPPAAWPEDCEHLRRVKALTFEANLLRKDGSFVPVELTVNYVAFGGVEYSCAFWRDITLRKQAEASLLKDLERGRMLLELYKKSAELNELELYNYALEQVARLTDSSIGFLHCLSPDQRSILLTTWTKATRHHCQVPAKTHYPIESAGVWADCVRLHRPVICNEIGQEDNRRRFPSGHVEVRRFMSIPVSVGRQVRLVFGVGNKSENYTERDIVQIQLVASELEKILTQRHAEESVRQSEERFRALVTASSEVIYWMSPDWSEMRHLRSQGFLAETRMPSRTWLGDYVPPEDQPQVKAAIEEAIQTKGVFELEHRVRLADGKPGWTFSRAIPLMDGQGRINEWFGAASDITERKRAEEALRQSRQQLQALTGRLQTVREEERAHLAREIHDVLAQELTCLKIEIVSLKNRLDRPGEVSPDQLGQRLDGMKRAVNRAVESVQKIATELRPVILDTLGLSAAIEWLMQDFGTRTGIQCETSVPAKPLVLDREQSTALFRILQESLTNVMRHAAATKVQVRLSRRSRQITLRVRDNGRGMEPSRLSDPHSIGLVGMRERALLLPGKCVINSRPGSGTSVEVRFNLPSLPAVGSESGAAAGG